MRLSPTVKRKAIARFHQRFSNLVSTLGNMSTTSWNSEHQIYSVQLSIKCQSYQLLHIRKWPLPGMTVNQLIVTIRVITHDNEREIYAMPLTPGRMYQEVHIQQRSKDGKPHGRPRVYFTSIREENEKSD